MRRRPSNLAFTLVELPAVSKRGRAAFTLVELLVVIGIIAVLIGVLLPVLARAREASNQTACLSNIRQVAIAFMMYANDNGGWLPASSRGGGPNVEQDFIHYQPARDLDRSALAKYLGKILDAGGTNSVVKNRTFNARILRCPSDDLSIARPRARISIVNDYRFSYVVNQYIGCGFVFQTGDATTGAKKEDAAGKITQIRRAAEKLLLYEEAEATIDDGHGTADLGWFTNLLAIRHDRRRANPEPASSFFTTPDRLISLYNGKLKGNAAFCDGSARYVSRSEMHSPGCYLPRR